MESKISAVIGSDKLRDLRVLVVDDNKGDRQLYKHMLAEADPGTNYEFLEAETGKAALHVMHSEKPDCVLLDYLLPDMLGLEFLNELAAQQQVPGPPIIMLTGFGDEATAVKAMQSGACGYIPKRDLTGELLIQAIDRAIRARKDLQKLEKTRQEMASKNRDLENKYQQIEGYYQKILGKIKQPVFGLRDQIAELANNASITADSPVHKRLQNLRVESEHLVITLKNLMESPALDAGQLLVSTCPESIMEVVVGSVNAFRAVAEAAGVRLSVNIQPGLPEVSIDRYRIEQVLVNVLDNAIKFTPARGQVSLAVDRFLESPQKITVSVSDTGVGINAGKLEGLFERKTQVLSNKADDSPGIGIGLHICKEIIHAHKGEIAIRSLAEGGTCLTFTLPVEASQTSTSNVWEGAIRRNGNPKWALHG